MMETIDNLKEKYREMAIAHGKATASGDYRAANCSHDALIDVLLKIRGCGKPGEVALRALSEDSDESVAGWSATHTLSFDEEHALAILDQLSNRPGPIGFNAKMVIQQWKKGKLVLP
jgi:hypothetical protein